MLKTVIHMRYLLIALFYVCLTCFAVMSYGQRSSLQVVGHLITLPQGQLFGVVLNPDGTVLISQQMRRLTGSRPDGSAVWERRLESVSILSGSLTKDRSMGDLPGGLSGHPPCGRMKFVQNGRLLVICSAGNAVEIVDTSSLETQRTISIDQPGVIADFAILSQSQLILLLRTSSNKMWLDRYSLVSGRHLDATLVSNT